MTIFRQLWVVLFVYATTVSAADYLSSEFHPIEGKNLAACKKKLNELTAGWCEIRQSVQHPSISSVWPKEIDQRTRMVTGPSSILEAWNSSAFDKTGYKLYFMGGGHADYGGNEVYEFDLKQGMWTRLTNSSPLNKLYIARDYDLGSPQPWRRLCWMQDIHSVPASPHTYDGLIFSSKTRTLFLYVMRAANGSCFEDKTDRYRNHDDILGNRSVSMGWYEFNPDRVSSRNGLLPLTWKKVFSVANLESKSINQGYPVSAEMGNGDLVFGSKFITQRYDPYKPDISTSKRFSSLADWGDGNMVYDKYRNIVWSLHKKALLSFDGNNGKLLYKIAAQVPHGKSIAVASDKKLYSWDGTGNISVINPDDDRRWKTLDWGVNGPPVGNSRVYGKWVYLEKENLFVGLSTHKTGVWVYKHPGNPVYAEYSEINPQQLIDQAKSGDSVTIPPGTYRSGLFINKSLSVNLKDVLLWGTVNNKGILNIKCDDCKVVIENFSADGIKANCRWGNCAAIKAEGIRFDLSLNKVYINGTVMGILTDNRGGQLILENSLIENTGQNSNSTTLGHGFYAGKIDRVVVKNSIIRRTFRKGHIFKSRAPDTLIENSIFAGMDGRHSRIIDFPCGGKLTIRNSVLQQGKQTDNIDLISVGTEPQHCGGGVHSSDISIKDSWLIFDRNESASEPAANYGFNRIFTWRAPMINLDITDNRIVESTGRLKFDGEGKVPDLSAKNRMFSSRKAAGLGPKELPSISIK